MALLPRLRTLRRPPYSLLAVFLAVAAVSAGTSGWLVWQLLAQDAAVERQRFQDRLEQAADMTSAKLQRALLDLEALARAPGPPRASLPDDVSVIELGGPVQRIEPGGLPTIGMTTTSTCGCVGCQSLRMRGRGRKAPADSAARGRPARTVGRDSHDRFGVGGP